MDPFDLRCTPGTITGVIGPNGSGKSTLLSGLAGTGVRTTGSIRYGDRDLAAIGVRERAGILAMVSQDSQRPNDLLVRDVVGIGAQAAQRAARGSGATAGPDAQERTEAAMARLGVDHLAERLFATLSGGQRQLVHLARVFAQDAPLMLLDEPLAALDLRHQIAVMDALHSQVAGGAMVVITLHDLSSAMRSCDRLLLLTGDGQSIEGTAAEVLRPEIIHRVYGVDTELYTSPATGEQYLNLVHRRPGAPGGPL